MQSQLQLVQGFVNDLLDLRQLHEGFFVLEKAVFDPADVFELVCNIFNPQGQMKGVRVFWSVQEPDVDNPSALLVPASSIAKAISVPSALA